jgi:hypothetical protein
LVDAPHAQTGAERTPGENASGHQAPATLARDQRELEIVGIGLDGHTHAHNDGGEEGALEEGPCRATIRIEDPADVAQALHALEARGTPFAGPDHHEALASKRVASTPAGHSLVVREQNHRAVERPGAHALEQVTGPSCAQAERDIGKAALHPLHGLGKGHLGERVRHPRSGARGRAPGAFR